MVKLTQKTCQSPVPLRLVSGNFNLELGQAPWASSHDVSRSNAFHVPRSQHLWSVQSFSDNYWPMN